VRQGVKQASDTAIISQYLTDGGHKSEEQQPQSPSGQPKVNNHKLREQIRNNLKIRKTIPTLAKSDV
jgi:hypothetical protein